MCSKNVTTKQIDYRIGRVGDRTGGPEEHHGLGCHELLSLGASRAVDPAGEARESVGGDGDLCKTGIGVWG